MIIIQLAADKEIEGEESTLASTERGKETSASEMVLSPSPKCEII